MSESPSQDMQPQITKSLRSRYEAVRPAIKKAIEQAFARGRSKKDISALREGAFHAAEQSEEDINTLKEEAYTDALTGLPRRKPFEDGTKRVMEEVKRNPEEKKLALSFFDIDDYGAFNKEHGEQAGDDVLKLVGITLKSNTRSSDILGRWGGEEMAITQIGGSEGSFIEGTERVRQSLAALDIPLRNGEIKKHLTASFGITEYVPGEQFEETLERVGTAMRLAKLFGKNRTVGATLRSDKRLDIMDYQTGNSYIYDSEIVDSKTGDKEVKEYLTDLTEQTRTRIVKDETGRKYKIKIEEVYDPEENPMPNPNTGK